MPFRDILTSVLNALAQALQGAPAQPVASAANPTLPLPGETSPGSGGVAATIEVPPPPPGGLRISYAPASDGDPDAGEVIWTWVPYAENDGRGKDRPVLVIGRAGTDRVYAVRLTSKSRDGDRDFFPIGAGPWDSKGRPSWVDIDQLYTVHVDGMRREASALDLKRFAQVAHVLQQRYGWDVGNG